MPKDILDEWEEEFFLTFGNFKTYAKFRDQDDVKDFIRNLLALKDKQIKEAYKKGYADGGIETINKQL